MTGTMMGSLESWLLLRSLRTLHLRVPRQSSNATVLAQWLNKIANTPEGKEHDGVPGGIVLQVWHDSLQGRGSKGDGKGGRPEFEPKEQMEGGFAPTFGMMVGFGIVSVLFILWYLSFCYSSRNQNMQLHFHSRCNFSS